MAGVPENDSSSPSGLNAKHTSELINELKTQNQALTEHIIALTEHNRSLKEQLSNLASQNATLTSQVSALTQKFKELTPKRSPPSAPRKTGLPSQLPKPKILPKTLRLLQSKGSPPRANTISPPSAPSTSTNEVEMDTSPLSPPPTDGFTQVEPRAKRRRDATTSSSSCGSESSGEDSDSEINNRSPPPINILNKELWPKIRDSLLHNDIAIRRAINTTDAVRVYPCTIENFRALTTHLDKSKVEYTTNQVKEERDFIVVIRGVNEAVANEDILQELKNKKLPVKHIHRMRKGEKIWPLVSVHLDRKAPGARSIFDIETIAGLNIKVEAKRKDNQVPQCRRCQKFFHTANYCRAAWICAFCSRNHATPACRHKAKEGAKPTCSNCKGEHSAAYRGCPKFPKKPPSRSTDPSKSAQKPNNSLGNTTPPTLTPPPTPLSYASVTKNSHLPSPQKSIIPSPSSSRHMTLQSIVQQFVSAISTILNCTE